MRFKRLTTRDLVLIAMYAALFLAMELLQNQFNLFKMPDGGSLSVSSVFLLLASYHLGLRNGIIVALVSVILQFVSGEMYLATGIFGFFLDYVLAYGIYGVASLFPNFKYFYSGVLITNVIRLASSTLSGVLFYQTTWWGSLGYNSTYMVPTIIIGIILVPLIDKRLNKQI